MEPIDIFYNSEIIIKRKQPKIIIYNIIILISLSLLLLFSCFYTYHPYLNLKASVVTNNQDYYLKVLISENDMDKLNNTNLLIKNKNYKYEIKEISSSLLDANYNKYYEILIICNINKSLRINNNIININIKLPKTTYMKKLIQEFKKGMT